MTAELGLGFVVKYILIAPAVSATVAGYLLWKGEDIKKWYDNTLGPYVNSALDKTVGKAFDKTIGWRIDLKSLEESIETDNTEQVIKISKRYGLEERALQMYESKGKLVEGARFAREAGNEEASKDFYRKAFESIKESRPVQAGEIAEEGEFLQEAFDLYMSVDCRVAKEKAMRLAERLDKPETAAKLKQELGYFDHSRIPLHSREGVQFGKGVLS